MESDNIAIFGASQDPLKAGSLLLNVLKETDYPGMVAGINPNGGSAYGFTFYKKLDEVPFQVDLAVMLIPPPAIPQAMMECAGKGVKCVVITAEGFGEAGEEGKKYQDEIAEILKSTGMRGFGPNTLGIINTETGLTTSYVTDERMLRPGHIGVAAQSGIFVGALLQHLSSFEKLNISKSIGLGNKIDVDECEALRYFTHDSQTKTVGLYLEDIRDGRKFMESARAAARRKPVVLLKSGRTESGARATASHTASLALNDAILEGALRQSGVIRVGSVDEMICTLMGFEWMSLPKGDRLAVVTYSGALGILSVDAAIDAGLNIAEFSDNAKNEISEVISTASKMINPIDVYPDLNKHGFEKLSVKLLEALYEDDGVHGIVLMAVTGYGIKIFQPIVDIIHSNKQKPIFIAMMGPRDVEKKYFDFMFRNRIPCYRHPEMAVKTFANMRRYAHWLRSQ